MTKNEELLEQDSALETTTDQEPALSETAETPQPADDMDLNELLSNMDQPMETADTSETAPAEPASAEEEPPTKPKRTSGRKKKTETAETPPETEEPVSTISEDAETAPLTEEAGNDAAPDIDSTASSEDTAPEPVISTEDQPASTPRPASRAKTIAAPIEGLLKIKEKSAGM